MKRTSTLSRRTFSGALLAIPLLARSAPRANAFNAQGSMAGEVTDTTALLQTRLTSLPGPALDAEGDIPGAEGVACFEYGTQPDFSDAQRTPWITAAADRDFIVRTQLTGLRAGQVYHYRPVLGPDQATAQPGASCAFATLRGAGSEQSVSFIVGSCMNYNKFMFGEKGKAGGPVTATEEDKRLGYPSFAAMASLKPDFFIGTGDIVYYDNILHGPARLLPQLRECWHEQFRFPRLIDFFSRTPSYWSKDDHDFRYDDADNETPSLPLPATGIHVFREQLPIHPAGDDTTPTYRSHRVNRDLQIWLTEGRDYRSPNKMEDGPGKSLWGVKQREWLESTLKASDAAWKILISPTPLVGPDDATKHDNHTNLGGFRHEADAFFAWLKENKITGFMTVCGDRHWQYHSIHPSGIEEFACGALNDENARVGVAPGSKKGTDPDALIKQPYTYPEPTGGFLRIRVSPGEAGGSKLVLEHHDDTGKLMNSVTKTAAKS